MRRTVLLLLAIPLLALAAGWAYLHWTYVTLPNSIIRRAIEVTSAHAWPGASKFDDAPREARSFTYQGRPCLIHQRNDLGLRVRLCGNPQGDPSERQLTVSRGERQTVQKELRAADSSSGLSDINHDLAIAPHAIYVAWIEHEVTEKQVMVEDRVRLLVVDPDSGAVSFDGVIHRQPWGLQYLTIGYHGARDTLWAAWKDISTKSNDGKIAGGIVHLHSQARPSVATRDLFTVDPWEKSSPQFHAFGDDLALVVRTGERWGLMSHEGSAAVGLSFVDRADRLDDYRIIAAEQPIRRILGLAVNRTILFAAEGDEPHWIAFVDAYAPEK